VKFQQNKQRKQNKMGIKRTTPQAEVSDPFIDSNIIANFKAQKGSKNIVKIVHVTTVVQTLML